MDSQTVIFFGGITLAVLISAYILWGPATQKRRKGQIVGLVNLGSTCFLNTLLQALASCAVFVEWLGQQKQDEGSLTAALNSVLWILNGQGSGDSYSPVEVLSALKRHGWVVPSGEQDAHELFHIIVSTLQEENKLSSKAGSISDALPISDTLSQTSDILYDCPDLPLEESEEKVKGELEPPQHNNLKSPSCSGSDSIKNGKTFERGIGDSFKSARNTEANSSPENTDYDDFLNHGDTESQSTGTDYFSFDPTRVDLDTGQKVNSRGDVHHESEVAEGDDDTLKCNIKVNKTLSTSLLDQIAIKEKKTSQENVFERSPDFNGCYDRVTGGALIVPQKDNAPFQGLLTSTLQCSDCGHYSCLKYDTFDSLSLPLVDSSYKFVSLKDLLKKFVKTEIVSDVDCEKCEMKTTAFKTLNFGKLPLCLCLHVSRSTWQSFSCTPTKRDDYVDFPEYLPLDEYTKSSNVKKTSSDNLLNLDETSNEKLKSYKHLYRLKSVVVHVGGVNSGHFLTYRRGPLNTSKRYRGGKMAGACMDSQRWYLASDDYVKLSTLCKAMNSLAYMLFYEKCSLEDE